MATLTFLGSAAAIPTVGHDNTFIAVEGEESTLLVDCAGSPVLKLQLAGIDPTRLSHLIVTHRHPDHLYGYPSLLLGLWLLGCPEPLCVVGEPDAVSGARDLLNVFHPTESWPGFMPPVYRPVECDAETVLLDLPDLLITAAPTRHMVPSIALRLVNKATGNAVVYSSDTGPCDSLLRLARGAQVLIHEASGEMEGHSSAAQAGRAASQSAVDRLLLIHYPAHQANLNALLTDARREFGGPTELARDLGALEF
jgi:ribonuclease Z